MHSPWYDSSQGHVYLPGDTFIARGTCFLSGHSQAITPGTVACSEHNHRCRILLHTNLNQGATCVSLSSGRAYVKTVQRSQDDRDPGPRGFTSTRGLHIFQRDRLELGMGGRNRSNIRMIPFNNQGSPFNNHCKAVFSTVSTHKSFSGVFQDCRTATWVSFLWSEKTRKRNTTHMTGRNRSSAVERWYSRPSRTPGWDNTDENAS